jgi:allophanate hydrolase
VGWRPRPGVAYRPRKDAAVVASLLAAGAILIGKTNLDQFATGLVGTRSPYGAVRNTFDPAFISGGSSSGSASVVARGVVPFALGTDTAGSGRVPAGFNNVVGLKPTPGRVPIDGVVPACRSLDCISVFALTAADAARVLAVIEQADAYGPRFSLPFSGPLAWSPRTPLRVAVPASLVPQTQEDYVAAFRTACDDMTGKLGAKVLPLDFQPLHDVADLLYNGPWLAERFASVGPFIERTPGAVNPVVSGLIRRGGILKAVDVFRGMYRLEELKQSVEKLWEEYDLLMVPTAPCHPTIDDIEEAPVDRNTDLGSYTNFVNLLGWCALAIPAGLVSNENALARPFGITWIARAGYDLALLSLGAEWHKIVSRHVPYLGAPSAGLVTSRIGCFDLAAPFPLSENVLRIAVVGAHLSQMPLHGQLRERRARYLATAKTAPRYRLYHLPNSSPPKPGLCRESTGGVAIEVEVYAFPQAHIGSFLALISYPLGLGSLELESGEWIYGFMCEQSGLRGAIDISEYGGWRMYINSTSKADGP